MLFNGIYDSEYWPQIAKIPEGDYEFYETEAFEIVLPEEVLLRTFFTLKLPIGIYDTVKNKQYLLVLRNKLVGKLFAQGMDFSYAHISNFVSNELDDQLTTILMEIGLDRQHLEIQIGGLQQPTEGSNE